MSYSNVYNRFKRLVYYFLNIDKYNLPIKLHIKKSIGFFTWMFEYNF